ncbi:MAG: enoyl-CoA hydratase-related protein, partial [Candidatus Yanofskybacteria bacterium]|nr:enoyl-CoA hydratase-related protein [Candidatus Yanofskybacteria bacterium]
MAKLELLKRGEMAIISMQNPPYNTLSAELLGEFPSILESVKNDPLIKAVIITGKGLFSAGAEVKDIWGIVEKGDIKEAVKLLAEANAVTDAVENFGKPTIAVIDGVCLGGGNELAMACSARIATEDSRFGQPEINLGIMPGMGGTQRLLLYVELEPALKLLLSGAMITAKEALGLGLIDRVVSKKDIFSEAKKFALQVINSGVKRNTPKLMNPENVRRIISVESFKTIVGSKSKDAVDSIIEAVEQGMLMLLPEALKNEQKLFAELAMKDSAKAGILAKFPALGGVEAKGARFLLPSNKLPNVFTVGDLNEDQLLIRDTVREIVAKTIATPEASAKIESKDFGYTRKIMKEFADVGLLGIEVPEEYGGVNLGAIVSAVAAEEISVQGSFATTCMAHSGIGTLPIKFFGNEEQKKKYLPKLVSGEWLSAYSLTEGTAGSDANSVKATAKLSEDSTHYILNGEKIFVTNGGFADLFIIFAK